MLPSPTEVVEIKLATSATGGHDHQAASASGTPQKTLEVVVVDALTRAGTRVAVQDTLHPVEDICTDQRFVAPGVFAAVVDDDPGVVRIPEQTPKLLQRDRALLGPPSPGWHAKSGM